jgi:ferritin
MAFSSLLKFTNTTSADYDPDDFTNPKNQQDKKNKNDIPQTLTDFIDEFEKEWMIVDDKSADLAARLGEVKKSSDKYFDFMDKIAQSLSQEEDIERELKANGIIKKGWNEEYNQALEQLNELDETIEEGKDIYKMLLIEDMRDKISTDINHLKEIVKKAKSASESLKELYNKGERLLKDKADTRQINT